MSYRKGFVQFCLWVIAKSAVQKDELLKQKSQMRAMKDVRED